jgi:hypothetical protein
VNYLSFHTLNKKEAQQGFMDLAVL